MAIAAFFGIVHAWHLAPTAYSVVGTQRLPWTVLFVALILIAAYATGLPELPTSRLTAFSASLMSVAAGLVGVSLAALALGSPLLPRVVLGGVSLAFVPWGLICWNAESDRIRRSTIRALFIGGADEYAELQADLIDETIEVELVGRLDGTVPQDIGPFVADHEVDLLVLEISSLGSPSVVTAVSAIHRTGVRVRTVSLFAEEFLGKIPVGDLERMSLLFDIGELHRATYVRWKRLIDIAFGVVGLSALIPVGAAIFVANLVGNRGPLLYKQQRIGKDGVEFEILKFRSMTSSSTASTDWTTEDDPRITPVGSLLRRSHLDELPQAWNVLRGDLSIVGPRPEQPHYVKALTEKIPFFDTRHLVRPGLTGWAQVNYPYGADEVDAREKLQYDLYYLRRQTPRLDLQILVRTIRTVVGRTGR